MTTTAIQTQTLDPKIIESIVLKGNIGALNPTQKVEYYRSVCERLGLDPAMQPFQLLTLNGREVMYASKAATEQLSRIYGVSHDIRDRQTVEGVFVVYVRASSGGRFTDASGAVNISGLKGDALANALMKAETKAKRRATLSLLGLGMLDESEVETIPGAVPVDAPVARVPAVTVGTADGGRGAGVETSAEQTATRTPASTPEHPVDAAVKSQMSGEKVEAPAKKHPTAADAAKLNADIRKRAIDPKLIAGWVEGRYQVAKLSELTWEQFEELRDKIVPGIDKQTIMAVDLTVWPNPLANERQEKAA